MISRTEEKLKAVAEEFGMCVACGEIILLELPHENLGKKAFAKLEEKELVVEQEFE